MLKFNLGEPGESENDAWYNTQEGVDKHLVSLADFHTLLRERRAAGYQRGERLDTFLVLDDKFQLDSCGNLNKRIDQNAFALGQSIPRPGLKCSGCKLEWTLENIDDHVFRETRDVVELGDFVGKQLGDVQDEYMAKTDAIYFPQPEMWLRADRFIDLSPKYPNPKEDWEKRAVKNEGGWVGEGNGITREEIIQEGDQSYFNIWKAFHKECNKADLSRSQQEKFRQMFVDAGFESPGITAVKNEYCGCDHCAPWYEVSTGSGTVKIGWRKRVINIDFSQSDLELTDALTREDVTIGEGYIHAWGDDKAVEYLSAMRMDHAQRTEAQ